MAAETLRDSDFENEPVLTDQDFLTDEDFSDAPAAPEGPTAQDFEGARETEKQVRQIEKAMPLIAEAQKQQEDNDPSKWTSKRMEQHLKDNPPKTVEEQAIANAALESKRQQEKALVDQMKAPPPKPPEPPPTPQDELAERDKVAQQDDKEKGQFRSFFEEAFVKPTKTTLGGVYEASARTANVMDFYATKISDATGLPKGGAFAFLRDNWEKTGRQLLQEGIEPGFVRNIYEGFGKASWDLPVYLLGSKVVGPYSLPAVGAVRGYAEGGPEGATAEALQGGIYATGIGFASRLPAQAALPAVAAGTAGLSIATGAKPDQTVADVVVNTSLTAMSLPPSAWKPRAPVSRGTSPGSEPAPGGTKPQAAPPKEPTIENLSKDGKSAVNLERMDVNETGKTRIRQVSEAIKPEVENLIGKPLTHEEVIAKAEKAAVLADAPTRAQTLELEAALLKSRQQLATMAESGKMTPEFLDTVRVVANTGTDIARQLESMKIHALPERAMVMTKIAKELMELGHSAETIAKAAEGVDFADAGQVTTFYRQFVKPSFREQLNEFAYINILSSPKTHIVNAFSNLMQLTGLNPATRLATGAVDMIGANLIGSKRGYYMSEVPAFYKGALNSFPEAFQAMSDVMAGKKGISRPDLERIPTQSKWIDYATLGMGKYVTRALEASDVLFRTMIEKGEFEALTRRHTMKTGQSPDVQEAAKIYRDAVGRSEYYVFRQKPDVTGAKTGQGNVLRKIDSLTNAVYGIRKEVPGAEWIIRFVETPMNIAKQGLEYSPAGVATIRGAKHPAEQIGKVMVGSMAYAVGSWFAMNNMSTWRLPIGKKEKELFLEAGMQPFSVKIGDKWVSYSKLGPLAYPMAMAAAIHYYSDEAPTALSDTEMEKVVRILSGTMEFFSDQSYLQGIGDLARTLQGDQHAIVRLFTTAPTQMVPMSSLQGWVNTLIDPLQRKPAGGLSVDSVADRLRQKLVGQSFKIPAQTDLYGDPRKRDFPVANSFSPVAVRQEDRESEETYRDVQEGKQLENQAKREVEREKERLLRDQGLLTDKDFE